MMNFCTYFDSHYVHKGLALYESLMSVEKDFTLYVMALDKKCFDFLEQLFLPNIIVENFENVETEELRSKKEIRTRAEYCWTCGPFIIEHFIVAYSLDNITYLDSDMMFYASPKIIFDEIGQASVALTEHNPDAVFPQGKYCVQYLFFRNDVDGMRCLRWWKERCMYWCYARFEGEDKYGDQKYLEKFHEITTKLKVIKNRGLCVATWNMKTFKLHNHIATYLGIEYPLIVFHFHGTKFEIINNKLVMSEPGGDVPSSMLECFNEYTNLQVLVHQKYLKENVVGFEIKTWSPINRLVHKIKSRCNSMKPIRWIYYVIFNRKYSGVENSKL